MGNGVRSGVELGPRRFSLVVAGHGIEAAPRWPAAIAHLVDGTLVLGPLDVAAAKAQGNAKNVLIKPGTPPTGSLAARRISEHSIVTYSTAERGSTQLVLGNGMQDYGELLATVRTAGPAGPWRIVTDTCEHVWPAGLLLRLEGDVTSPTGPIAFAKDGAVDKLITFHGPYTGACIPTRDQLIPSTHAPGETGELDGATGTITWWGSQVELAGVTWIQRYYDVPLGPETAYILRAQTTLELGPPLFAAADEIARSLRPRS